MKEQAEIGATDGGGLHRLTLSDDDKRIRDWFHTQMEEAGLTVRVDEFGNMFGRREGTDPNAGTVLVGSHLDSQPYGGIYDGAMGVLAALEFVRTLDDEGVETAHPVEVVNWTNEEGSRFQPAMQGSGVWAGAHDIEEEYAKTDADGSVFEAELERIGYKGSTPCEPQHDYEAYLELHIEQGPYLEENDIDVGVVTGIVGFTWGAITFYGEADHSGPTPMHYRNDALVAAADVISQIRRIPGTLGERTVGTTGYIDSKPNSINIIPDEVTFTWGFRDHERVIDSSDALELDYVPSSMLVVGGGIIGSELAGIFHAFGSRVTVVEGMDRILPVPSIDPDMSKLLQKEMKKRKIGCELCRTAVKAEPESDGISVTLGPSPFIDDVPKSAQEEKEVKVDVVLVAVGRVPNTEGLGLDAAGVDIDRHGWIITDERCRTSCEGVYAIGDVLGPDKIMLAHVASMEGLVAAGNCLGQDEVMEYSSVPSAVFTSPEVASVGLTEIQAREQGYNVSCKQSQFRELGKAHAMGELSGVFKLIFDADSDKLLGAHLAGAHVSDIIAEPTLALSLGASGRDIARTIHAHPTLAEGIFEAVHKI